ncbi:MAG TPA: phage minor capsid protein [Virgibacillus sp.]|nr:phage minor capsid protein [Virgibacillus sp.]HLR69434.1 phage minor capsid protein [Virgibacillus sp.]
MNQKQLIEVIKAMKHEILDLLINHNLADDDTAQQTLNAINEMFKRMDLEIDDVIPKETLVAYFGGVDDATKALEKAGVSPIGGIAASISSKGIVRSAFNSQVHLEAIAEITDNTILDLKAAIRTARRNANTSIETALESVKSDLQSGIIKGDPRKVITQRVAESFAKEGMTSFVTVDGKKLSLEHYSEIVTRTSLKQAHTKGMTSRYEENGEYLFTLDINDPTCSQCEARRGIIFTSDPGDEEFPYLSDDDVHPHPQCQCSKRVYVRDYKSNVQLERDKERSKKYNPDVDNRSKSQKEAYERQQALNRQANAEKKQFIEWNATLGAENYKTLGAFRRAKRSNSVRFQELQSEFRSLRMTKSIK